MTYKGEQRYLCHNCDTNFTVLTGTIFANHKLALEEMFYIIKEMEAKSTAQITRELGRTYKTVLDFVHEVQTVVSEDAGIVLSAICEADEVYVIAGEKGTKQESPRERGLKKRGAAPPQKTNHPS
jgi:hypothetical protein